MYYSVGRKGERGKGVNVGGGAKRTWKGGQGGGEERGRVEGEKAK